MQNQQPKKDNAVKPAKPASAPRPTTAPVQQPKSGCGQTRKA